MFYQCLVYPPPAAKASGAVAALVHKVPTSGMRDLVVAVRVPLWADLDEVAQRGGKGLVRSFTTSTKGV